MYYKCTYRATYVIRYDSYLYIILIAFLFKPPLDTLYDMLKSFLTEFLGSSQNLKHFPSLKVLQHILNGIKPKIRVGMKLVIGVGAQFGGGKK